MAPKQQVTLSSSTSTSSGGTGTGTSTSSEAIDNGSKICCSTSCPLDRNKNICQDISDAIGQTPLVRLNHVTKACHNGICDIHSKGIEMLVKCEFFNAGGSVKDRIAKQMILDAEKEGILKRGVTTLIEPTSGNTGIGLALCAAIRGYRCIIVLPEKMSKEKVDVLKALGAEIVRTPTEAAYDAPDSHISVAKRLNKEIPNSVILDQYSNPSNPNAHYFGTAQEIWDQCQGKIDMLVAGTGTGGTISGIAKRLKELNPDIKVIGVDPEGSILARPDHLNNKNRLQSYQVEGIGYDFIPKVLNLGGIDQWYKSNDCESLVMMRKMIRYEGLLCGGSCGAAVSCAIQAVRDNIDKYSLRPGSRVVIVLPDSVRNYMTKALSDDWMLSHGFIDNNLINVKQYQTWWSNSPISDLRHRINIPVTITCDVTCKDAIALLKSEGFDMVPVLNDDGSILGVVTEGNMTKQIVSGRIHPSAQVSEAGVIYKTFHCFTMNDTLGDLATALDQNPFALIVTEQRCYVGRGNTKASSSSSSGGIPRKRKHSEDSSSMTSTSSASTTKASSTTTKTTSTSTLPPRVVKRSVVSGIVTRIDLLDYISSPSGTNGISSNNNNVAGKYTSTNHTASND